MAVILPSVYRDGTATVANGGTAVTGQSTLWANAILPGDFFGVHKGRPIRVASVESNTALTLADPWPEASQTTAAYAIMLQSDMARVQETTRQLLMKLAGGNLDAFAGLTGADKKIPYFTGAGTMAVFTGDNVLALGGLTGAADTVPYFTAPGTMTLANLKAKGREVIDSENMSVLLSRLGPVLGGPAPVPSAAELSLADGDFNTLVLPGVYTIASNWLNGPSGAGSFSYTGVITVLKRSFNNGYWQILRIGTSVWRRYTSTSGGASWPNPWEVIENKTLGTVSQSSGNPTGAILERGSNSNGEYIKLADGTMICWQRLDISSISVSTARGSLYGMLSADSAPWTFPAAFVSGSTVCAQVTLERSDWTLVFGGSIISVSATTLTYNLWGSATNPGGNNKIVNRLAIGRWF